MAAKAAAVQGERHVAATAPPRLRAGAAVERCRGSAPVLEDDRAAAAVLDLTERVEQRTRERVAAVQAQVDDLNGGQATADPGREAQPPCHPMPDLGPRRRAPVDGDRAFEPGPLGGNPAGVVARVGLVLVRSVVLLVDDDDPEVGHRREHRRPRADDHPSLAGGDAAVLGAAPARLRPLCRTATVAPNRAVNRGATCGVRAISGTSTIAPRPSSSAGSISRR